MDKEAQKLGDATDAPQLAPQRRRRESHRLLRAKNAYIAGLVCFAVFAVLAHAYTYFVWDLPLARAIQSIDFPGWAYFMKRVSYFGNGWHPHVLTVLTALIFLVWRRRSECFGLILSAGGGALINNIAKLLVGRPRPAAELVGFAYASRETSFPSGHVTFYVCYFGFLFFIAYTLLSRARVPRYLILVLTCAIVVLVGISRIYLRAHWPSDVIGAYLLSGTWLVFSLETYLRWKRRATLHPEETQQTSD
jgi:membrane-associated phospholipid phosphatase